MPAEPPGPHEREAEALTKFGTWEGTGHTSHDARHVRRLCGGTTEHVA